MTHPSAYPQPIEPMAAHDRYFWEHRDRFNQARNLSRIPSDHPRENTRAGVLQSPRLVFQRIARVFGRVER